MVAVQDAQGSHSVQPAQPVQPVQLAQPVMDVEAAALNTGRRRPTGGSRIRVVGAAVALAVVSAGIGWGTPKLVAAYDKPKYEGKPASVVAKDMGCSQYTQAAKHDDSVYHYHDQGTCSLGGTIVTVTTFDRASDGDTFASVMRAVIPVLHPTWVGATYAAGDSWNVADARNLTPEAAELAVRRLGLGATHIIPSSKGS